MPLATLFQYARFLKRSREDRLNAHRLPYSKACNLEDFSHADMRELIRSAFPHDRERFGDEFPAGREARHYWQAAMTARAFADHGVLGPDALVLGIAAGNDPALFWLTEHVGRVFAADLYLNKTARAGTRCPSMLVEPDRHWPGSWDRQRLVVQHLGCQELRYSNESFEGVFAPHALESCTSTDEVEQCLEELLRVLKPGGILSLTVEFAVEGPADLSGGRLFDEPAIRQHILKPLPWSPVGPVDLDVSAATRQTEQPAERIELHLRRHLERHGQLFWHEAAADGYPHLAVRDGAVLSVPVHLALRKRGWLG
jgi:hypothetical protein